MTIFYAKTDETYQEHIERVYNAWEEVIKVKQGLIHRVAQKYGFSPERFKQGSLLTIVLHDIGKMIIPFQEMMSAKRNGKSFNLDKNYRHELVSFMFVFAGFAELQKRSFYSRWPLEALSVAGHHRALDGDLSSFAREKIADRPVAYPEGIALALKIARELFDRNGWDFPTITEKWANVNGIKRLAKFITEACPELLKVENLERTRVLYFLLKGCLHYADWYGSGHEQFHYSVQQSPEYIIHKVEDRCREKNIPFQGLSIFQRQVADQEGHVIAIAPTGSGKTEASILWALKNSISMGEAKIIYLLPTMATANSIWYRISQFFGEDSAGLTHSSANLLFNQEIDEETVTQENRRNLLFDQAFIRPVTVGTVDQLLATGFNAGKWVLKEINAANAVIIIDEIHAYDGWTLGLIISTIKHFAGLGARFLLMSATMPQNLIQLFQNELSNITIIKDKVLLNAKRSRYFVKDKLIEDDQEEIRNAVLAGYKVLVVVNTVDKCQRLMKQFLDLAPVCYHARFILKDRKDIESKIETARFVIATQIVEVSLDIDFDWLFTECAPPDAIAQRAGRVNRYRDSKRDSRIFIYRPDKKSEKLYNPLNDHELLEKTFLEFSQAPEDMTEQNLLDIIENVYAGYPYETREGFTEALEQYQLSQKNRLGIFDSRNREEDIEKTRMTKYETTSVIPYYFFNEIMTVSPKERRWYEVKIPNWYLFKNKREHDGVLFCDVIYDQELGVILKNDDRGISM
jgi:CRISPR-associated endonuclease/helicase Cas3